MAALLPFDFEVYWDDSDLSFIQTFDSSSNYLSVFVNPCFKRYSAIALLRSSFYFEVNTIFDQIPNSEIDFSKFSKKMIV
jgi:hypothetical protein